MAKKVIKYIYIALVVVFGSLLVYLNFKEFINITGRLGDIINFPNIKCFFQKENPIFEEAVKEINEGIQTIINETINSDKTWQEHLRNLSISLFDNVLEFLIVFLNFGVNILLLVYIYFNKNFTKTNLKIKKSFPAKCYLFFLYLIGLFINLNKKAIRAVFCWLKDNKKLVFFTALALLLASSILYRILVETIIFYIVYIYKIFTRETLSLLTEFFKYIFALIYPYFKNVSTFVWICLFLVLLFFQAIIKAEHRLEKNHQRLKAFVKDKLTQTTFINGPPGSGKTLLNVSCTLAGEENYIEELEEKMLNYEIKRPSINFAEMRKDETKLKQFQEYSDFSRMLNSRGTFTIANFAIYSPYFKEFCKIFDFNYMRKNIKTDNYPLEEYIIISISEFDKEYNSHDDMKKVGADGASTFFSTTSHDLKRHVKIFCDYQLKDQVPLRIRGNSEYFYTIKSRQKKYPFLLYLYYLPILFLSKTVRRLIKKYETKRPYINIKTKRRTISQYKRNDVNLLYLFLRQSAYVLDKISDCFDHYWYFKLEGDLSQQDGAEGEKKNICLNVCDLSIEKMALYDSTFLSFSYEQKKNKAFKELRRFSSLIPNIDELSSCHSQFYDKLNGIETPAATANKPNKGGPVDDDFIEINND